jgi:hypothetical protein
MLDEGAALVSAHPAEHWLYEWHAMSVVPWMSANGAAHPVEAAALWERTVALAAGREQILAKVLQRFGIEVPKANAG